MSSTGTQAVPTSSRVPAPTAASASGAAAERSDTIRSSTTSCHAEATVPRQRRRPASGRGASDDRTVPRGRVDRQHQPRATGGSPVRRAHDRNDPAGVRRPGGDRRRQRQTVQRPRRRPRTPDRDDRGARRRQHGPTRPAAGVRTHRPPRRTAVPTAPARRSPSATATRLVVAAVAGPSPIRSRPSTPGTRLDETTLDGSCDCALRGERPHHRVDRGVCPRQRTPTPGARVTATRAASSCR